MDQPIRIINGVEIYRRRRWGDYKGIQGVQESGLERMSIMGGETYFENSDRIKQLFPDLFPSDEFHVSIRQAIYIKVLNVFRKYPNRKHQKILEYIQNPQFGLSVSHNDMVRTNTGLGDPIYEQIQKEINDAYRARGYEYYYFGWINPKNPYFMAKRGTIPLRPDTFEVGTFLTVYPSEYREVLRKIKSGSYQQYCQNSRSDKLYSYNYLGWKKSELQQAILNSGLVSSEPYKTDPNRRRTGIKWKNLDINIKGFAPSLSKRDGWVDYPTPYLKMCYWDTIYRKFFNTTSFINWPYLCSNRIIDYNTLKKIAQEDFGLPYNQIKRMKYGDICNRLSEISEQKQEMAKSISKLTKPAASQIILRPYSPWVSPPSRQLFKEGAKLRDPLDIYNSLVTVCESNPTKVELIQHAVNIGVRNLLPVDLSPYPTESICEFLLEDAKQKAEAYGRIEFDCSNPHIDKINIINSATIMGLGGVLPKDLSNLSKEDICNIISDYIRILRTTKEPVLEM